MFDNPWTKEFYFFVPSREVWSKSRVILGSLDEAPEDIKEIVVDSEQLRNLSFQLKAGDEGE